MLLTRRDSMSQFSSIQGNQHIQGHWERADYTTPSCGPTLYLRDRERSGQIPGWSANVCGAVQSHSLPPQQYCFPRSISCIAYSSSLLGVETWVAWVRYLLGRCFRWSGLFWCRVRPCSKAKSMHHCCKARKLDIIFKESRMLGSNFNASILLWK